MAEFSIKVNGEKKVLTADSDTPLLWVLRDILNLTGTKYGCGIGICGACTVLVNGKAERSCSITIEEVNGKSITTIEGLAANPNNPILKTWIDVEVSQCGYCQPGQIMNVAALIANNNKPTKREIDETMNSVLCRCGTYNRIKKAILKIVEDKQ
ncbi:(2Fe-2S)-binding protein [Melioribacteraceae bacterium 4301-Me]|uniref:(2Fe-2S)-binding protein n=1 Tax=Pyranulibacter aquaticus TaxID=3163344 RepID=UPI003598E3F1